jgi:glutamine amidotransferase
MTSSTTIGVVDYAAGNLRSLCNALETVSAGVKLVRTPEDLRECSHVVLPGVGAFGHCVDGLRRSGMIDPLAEWVMSGNRPLLGICVGMQMLADIGEEHGEKSGLGWIPGRVSQLPASRSARVPHVGWNDVRFGPPCGPLAGDFYFDHSFRFCPADTAHSLGVATHGIEFCAAVRKGSVLGVQFHPEKSQEAGLRFLRWFVESRELRNC